MGPDRARNIEGEPGRRLPPEEADPGRFRWIVDGHNAIFAVAAWENLQVSGRRREARLALEEKLESFGRAVGARVLVVYDGNHLERNPDAVDLPNLKSHYPAPPVDADTMIIYLATQAVREGVPPVVVSSDRRTLVSKLPTGCRAVDVRDFFRRIHARALFVPEKSAGEGMEDIERYFLSRSPDGEDRAGADGPPGAAGGPGERA
jgi:predicted RNA-binding protein with PIN domain